MNRVFDQEPHDFRAPRERPHPRPDRFAFWAVILAVVAMIAGVATADAGTGGVSTGDDSAKSADDGTKSGEGRYTRIWTNRFGRKPKRWARRTSRCESGHNPKAYNPAGPYYGAFQFLKRTWRSAPRSPGLKPTRFRWRTQAVVAVLHKRKARRNGWPNPWPHCG